MADFDKQNEIILTKKLILRTDKNFIINFVSKSFRDFTFLKNQIILLKPFEEIIYYNVPKIFLKEIFSLLKRDGKIFTALTYKMGNGFYFWANTHINGVDKYGNFTEDSNLIESYIFCLEPISEIDKEFYIKKFQNLKTKNPIYLKH